MLKYINSTKVWLVLGLITFLIPWVFAILINSMDGFFLGLFLAIAFGITAIIIWIGVASKKNRNNIKKSAIIFGILAVLYGIFGIIYCMNLPLGLSPPAFPSPSVSLFATPNATNCTITIRTPTTANIQWNDTWYHLVNISSGQTHTDSTVTIPRNGTIVSGDIINIAGGLHNNSKYRLYLIYNNTGGTMGTVSWTQ